MAAVLEEWEEEVGFISVEAVTGNFLQAKRLTHRLCSRPQGRRIEGGIGGVNSDIPRRDSSDGSLPAGQEGLHRRHLPAKGLLAERVKHSRYERWRSRQPLDTPTLPSSSSIHRTLPHGFKTRNRRTVLTCEEPLSEASS